MALDIVIPSVEQHCVTKCKINAQHGKRPYHRQLSVVGFVSFLKPQTFKAQVSADKIMASVSGFRRTDSC
jgi:hypothetical protein